MKAFRINTELRQVEEIEINDWKDIAPAIGNGCTTFTCPVELDNMDTIYSDDDGLYHEIKGGFMMANWDYPIVGNSLLMGSDDEGESVDVKTTKEELEAMILWQSKENCERWASNFN